MTTIALFKSAAELSAAVAQAKVDAATKAEHLTVMLAEQLVAMIEDDGVWTLDDRGSWVEIERLPDGTVPVLFQDTNR